MESTSRKWWVLTAVCLITVMLAIDATALNIAIPVIANEFHASLSNMQWVVNAFFILAAMVQIPGGHLGDSYGHKKIFLINTLLFMISSLGAALSVNEGMLITFRALQGASIGVANPLTIVLLLEAFPKYQQAFARSFIVATMGIALAIGAPLGGLIVHTIGWRWIFFINVPVGVLCYVLAQINCKSVESEKVQMDIGGTSLLILALFFVSFACNQVQNWGFSSWLFWGCLMVGCMLIFLLYLKERKQEKPIVNFSLFKQRNFSINTILRFITQVIFLGILFFIPLYLQNVSDLSALTTGVTMFALTLIMCVVSPIAGKWIDKKGDKSANITTTFFFIAGSITFLFLTNVPNFWILSIGLILFGIAIAISFVSTITGAIANIKKSILGIATGVFFTIAWLGCAIGVALSGTMIALIAPPKLTEQLNEQNIVLSPNQMELADRGAKGLSPLLGLKDKVPSFEQIQKIASNAFAEAIHANIWIFVGLSVLGLLLAFFIKKQSLEPPREV